MRDIDLAWAAGFLDGEGHFGINRGHAQFRPFMSAAQARRTAPLYKLKELLGGTVHQYSYAYENSNCTWRLGGAQRLSVAIPMLLPYLVVKRDEAEILLCLANMIVERGNPGRAGLSEDEQEQRESVVELLLDSRV